MRSSFIKYDVVTDFKISCTAKNCRGIVIDAGHINVESDLAPPEVVQQMKAKRSAEYTSEDYIRLRSLMYDKFDVHLTQTKILIGESVETCLEQVRRPKPENNYLHLVERIDMSFLLEMCIIPHSTDFTNFRISGHLPLLAVNFSDTKYRTIMQIPRLIEASGLLNTDSGEEEEEFVSSFDEPSAPENIKPHASQLMHTRLWKQASGDLLLESESDSDGSVTESEVETADTTIASQSRSARSIDKKRRNNINRKIFELKFKVDKVSASILEANKSDVSAPERLLCDLLLQSLSVDFGLRPHDMTVNVALKSLHVTDHMKHGNEFKYLVTSDQEVFQGQDVEDDPRNIRDLVNVQYLRIDPSSPEFLDKYDGIHQAANVTLSTLNFVVTRSSVLTLYMFILNTFVENENVADTSNAHRKSKGSSPSGSPESQRSAQFRNDKIQQQQQQQQKQLGMQVTLLLDSVNFILNNDGIRLATGELSHGDMTVLLANGTTKVAAKFANFTLTDDLTPPKEKRVHKPYDRQLLTIQGEELVDLRFDTYLKDDEEYPGYDQSLYVKMGSAQFTFLERPVRQLLEFMGKFAAMKAVYDRARQAALESAQQLQQSTAKTHFDITIMTPVVLFPEMHRHPLDVVVAHLGEISASNEFRNEDNGCINAVKAGIRAISLTSKYYHQGHAEDQLQLQTLPIIDNIDLDFDISSMHEGKVGTRPDVDIVGSITDIRMHLTDRQYAFLMDAINMFSRVLTPPQSTETAKAVSPPPLPKRSPLSMQAVQEQRTSSVSPEKQRANMDEDQQTNEQPNIRLKLKSNTIGLDVYMAEKTSNDPQAVVDLSRIALNGTAVEVLMLKDNSINVDLQVSALTVDDTRPNIKSKFKNIIPANENGHQFELQLDISPPEPTRHGIALITVNDPRVVLSLDHAFLLLEFFTKPFGNSANNRQQQPGAAQSPGKQRQVNDNEADAGMEIFYRLNVIHPEFILLANPDATDSEAIVLSADQVMISRQAVVALAVRQVGMFLCRMDMRQTSTLRFIQTFDVSLSMNNNADQVENKTELAVDVDLLVLRLSYRDALLITDIFNKAYELYNQSRQDTQALPPPPSSPTQSFEMPQIVSSVGQTLMQESVCDQTYLMQELF